MCVGEGVEDGSKGHGVVATSLTLHGVPCRQPCDLPLVFIRTSVSFLAFAICPSRDVATGRDRLDRHVLASYTRSAFSKQTLHAASGMPCLADDVRSRTFSPA